MLRRIRESRVTKVVSAFLAFNFMIEFFQPLAAYALTSGPSQPEVQSFQPIGITDMVDPFTGDYSYNIPLLDVGGYPINMIYNSGITMDQEASWVGLGWNINPGVINRNMRGIPDDFAGDKITQDFNMKPNKTYGLSAGLGLEGFGLDLLSVNYSLGVNYNNYNGIGFEQTLSPSISAGVPGKENGCASLGLSISAGADGLTLSPSISYSEKMKTKVDNDTKMVNVGGSVGVKINSRAGLQSLTIGTSGGPASKSMAPQVKSLRDAIKTYGAQLTASSSGGSTISLANTTYVPQQDFPRLNTSVSFSTKFGGTLFGTDATFNLGGFYSENRLLVNNKATPSYGYLYEQSGQSASNTMLDFNREKDGPFTRSTPNLPVSNHSYDVYSISGQGIGGMFRPFRGDVGYLRDPEVNSISGSGTLGLELSSGNAVHIGADVNLNVVTSHSGVWSSSNDALPHVKFQSSDFDDPYESVYLKQAGEKTVDDDPIFLSSIGGTDPVRIPLSGPKISVNADAGLESPYGTTIPAMAPAMKRYNSGSGSLIKRVKRNMPISYLTKRDAANFGVEGYVSPSASQHHIAESTVLRTDGTRYVYGIAAYNTLQEETSFSVGETNDGDCSTGLVSYTATDASVGNQNGRDNYFNKTTTPAYAHSFLLTSVLSPDYSDVDQVRGPSQGDYGSYTKFNYGDPSQSNTPSISNYKWRTPFEEDKASYNEGLKTLKHDDKGSYVYGEKDVWYLKNIETKTHIAIFYVSDRRDGFECAGPTGGLGSNSMQKLDSIRLFSQPDFQANGVNAVPIKVVHFEYDYSLCPSVPNNDKAPVDVNGGTVAQNSPNNVNINEGKLTLKKVYFTYQKSYRGKLSPYEFTYADLNHDGVQDANPLYNIKGYDRWGYFKDNLVVTCDLSTTSPYLPASDFPYVRQDNKSLADKDAGSWSLTSIKLPSGGNIDIDYESDEYAYVQDKPAMQMMKIIGCGNSTTFSTSNTLYNSTTSPNCTPGTGNINNYLYFDIPTGINSSNFQNYIKDIASTHLYFRFLMSLDKNPPTNLSPDNSNNPNIDYVSGYSKIDVAGICTDNVHGYVRVSACAIGEDEDSNDANPISKAAWQYCRLYNQPLAYNQPQDPSGSIDNVMKALANASLIGQFVNMVEGVNTDLRIRGFAKYFVPNKSWIRLYNPDGKKLGGGLRVKKLRIFDNWNKMNVDYDTNIENGLNLGFDYGQEYFYDTKGDGSGQSSGVASYEPMPGGDENPFRQPVFFTEKHVLAPDDRNYQEEPYGEGFFPGAGVGYGKVTVRNLQRDYPTLGKTVKRHATGYTVHEFYTAKDFPTWTDRTNPKALEHRPNFLGSIFSISHKNFMTASQGYVIELNDMHGKPKAQWVYAENQNSPGVSAPTPISGVEYKYNTITETKTRYPSSFPTALPLPIHVKRTRLENSVKVINKWSANTSDPDLLVETKEVGVDVDFVTDFRESESINNSFALKGNLAAFLAAIVPISVPTILPSFTNEKTRFRSAVATKVINRYGILRETIAHDLGSQVSTENLAWDSETGEVLLTQTKNNFDDYVYNFTYPAHWGYDRMGGGYQNIGYVEHAVMQSFANKSAVSSSTGYLVKGDEVAVYSYVPFLPYSAHNAAQFSSSKAWVWDLNNDTRDGFYLIDKNGQPFNKFSSSYAVNLKVIRSGRRNMQSMPIGTITTLKNPISGSSLIFTPGAHPPIPQILNASMQEYSENWGTFCTPRSSTECVCVDNQVELNRWQCVFDYLLSTPANDLFCSGSATVPLSCFPDIFPSQCPSTTSLNWTMEVLGSPSADPCTTSASIVANLWNMPKPVGSCDDPEWPYVFPDCQMKFTPLNPSDYCLEVELPQCGTTSEQLTWGDLLSIQITGTIPAVADCGDPCPPNPKDAIAMATFSPLSCSNNQQIIVPVRIHAPCISFGSCTTVTCVNNIQGEIINPYVAGVRGDWRPIRTFAFQTDRQQFLSTDPITDPAGNYKNTSIREDGVFASYNNFWNPPSVIPTSSIKGNDWGITQANWTFVSEVEQYSPFGFEIENQDALQRYSGAIYGYGNTLPKAVASNAGQRDIAFDGFEDVQFNAPPCCEPKFKFINPSLEHFPSYSSSEAHTGRFSFVIPATTNNIVTTEFMPFTTSQCTPQADDMPYTIKPCDVIHDFSPRNYLGTRDFMVSFWVKVPQNNNDAVFDYKDYPLADNIDLQVYMTPVVGSPGLRTPVETSKSDIIDGWQRIEERYTITSNDINIQIAIENTGLLDAYFDDIRVQPFNSSMKSFVYDPVSLRLWAELDERNFATIYEYDEDGALMRVKKETERGIMTVQESRNHTAH